MRIIEINPNMETFMLIFVVTLMLFAVIFDNGPEDEAYPKDLDDIYEDYPID